MSKILIVEDDPLNKIIVTKILEQDGHSLILLNSSLEVLSKAKELVPDLILLDVYLPGIDGLEVLKLLKQKE